MRGGGQIPVLSGLKSQRAKVLVLSVCLTVTPSLCAAMTIDPRTRGVMEFIGALEAPRGYNDYFGGVSAVKIAQAKLLSFPWPTTIVLAANVPED